MYSFYAPEFGAVRRPAPQNPFDSNGACPLHSDMDPVLRSSMVDRTETALMAGIRKGVWNDTLPGVRILCRTFKVSPPTLQAATGRLLTAGVLLSDGPRRRLRISKSWSREKKPDALAGRERRRVLFLSGDPLSDMPHSRLEVFSGFRLECPDWDVRLQSLSFEDAKVPRRQWDQLIRTEEPDALVVFNGTPVIGRWAAKRKLKTVFIGGDSGGLPIPTIGMMARGLIRDAIDEFARHGHRHICMPVIGAFPRLQEGLGKTMAEEMERAGLPFDVSWNMPTSTQHDPDVLLNILTRVFKVRIPTAVIAMTWSDFVTIQSFLNTRRLAIPDDVSVLVLSTSSALRWVRPQLTHFTHGVGRVARTVRDWIDKGFPADCTPIALTVQIVRGGSVGPPRPGS